jgi:hypothetical protein
MKIFQIMRSNNDGKYKLNKFNAYYESNIIKCQFMVFLSKKIVHSPML